MEEQELIEAKRARNFIWTAAEKYEFEPMFLAFSPDGISRYVFEPDYRTGI